MGDRCYMTLFICGHIKTVDDFNEIVARLESEGWQNQMAGTVREAFIDALVKSTPELRLSPEFFRDEVNYANIDEIEGDLQEKQIAYYATNGSGDEYGAGARSWCLEHGAHSTDLINDTAVLSVEQIKHVLKGQNPLVALNDLIVETEIALGVSPNFPSFSVSDEVRNHLAVDIAKKALAA